MKRIALFTMLICICGLCFAQRSIYVSASGNDRNLGYSEAEPLNSLVSALTLASMDKEANRIIIIGMLNNDPTLAGKALVSVFHISDSIKWIDTNREILITGKPNASTNEKAILSARGSNKCVAEIEDLKIRFEHIEISGGEGNSGFGLYIINKAQVTLGTGTVVRGNSGTAAVVIVNGACTIDGGQILNNQRGAFVYKNGILTLRDGAIRDNSATDAGGGVIVGDNGRFIMSGGTITGNSTGTNDSFIGGGVNIIENGIFIMTGGSITNNRAQGAGGGVYVASGGKFEQNGGTITNNTAGLGSNPNIFRAKGSL